MTTVINNPGNGEGSGGVAGIVVGMIALIVVIAIFFVYVLPMIRNSNVPPQKSLDINVTLPTDTAKPAGN
ncbi:MAG: hypothetical protein WAV09_01210 [Minisyncoccia bacterium]